MFVTPAIVNVQPQPAGDWHDTCSHFREANQMGNAALRVEEISRDHWNAVLAAITRDYRGAHARLEVIGPDVGSQVQTDDRPFYGIAADVKDRECVIWIHFDGLDHGVHSTNAIRMLSRIGEAGPVIEIEDNDGVKTILTLEPPEKHELPPGEGRGRK
jgi:hypothetical protein